MVDSLGNGPLGNQSSQHCCHCLVGAGTEVAREAGVVRVGRGGRGEGREGRGVKEGGQAVGRRSTEVGHPPERCDRRRALSDPCSQLVCEQLLLYLV
jgi:hypothetical protein